jgi:hypothetical protein
MRSSEVTNILSTSFLRAALGRFVSPKEVQEDHDERNEEDQVNESTGDMQTQAENPTEDEDDSDKGEHDS